MDKYTLFIGLLYFIIICLLLFICVDLILFSLFIDHLTLIIDVVVLWPKLMIILIPDHLTVISVIIYDLLLLPHLITWLYFIMTSIFHFLLTGIEIVHLNAVFILNILELIGIVLIPQSLIRFISILQWFLTLHFIDWFQLWW